MDENVKLPYHITHPDIVAVDNALWASKNNHKDFKCDQCNSDMTGTGEFYRHNNKWYCKQCSLSIK